MTSNTFRRTSGAIFLLIAVLHVCRLIWRWEALIGGWHVPLWISWAAVLFAGYLAYAAFTVKD